MPPRFSASAPAELRIVSHIVSVGVAASLTLKSSLVQQAACGVLAPGATRSAPIGAVLAAFLAVAALSTGVASASTTEAASAHASGATALVIILVILALIVIGAFVVIRFIIRKGKDLL
jgi:hypothetical protein